MSVKGIGHSVNNIVDVCGDQPQANQVLVTGARSRHATFRKLERKHVNETEFPDLRPFVFGLGRLGTLDFDGTSTVAGIAPSGGVYALTKDIYAGALYVRTGVRITTAGYRIFASVRLRMEGTAVIEFDGNPGYDGTAGNGGRGLKPDSQTSGTLAEGGAGGFGGDVTNGVPTAGSSTTFSIGGSGGAGGNGTQAGAAGGTATPAEMVLDNLFGGQTLFGYSPSDGAFRRVTGGAGGGGGGGDTAGATFGGGGSGNGGGVVFIATPILDCSTLTTGRISANGGDGGDGGGETTGGGGGGGGGGVVIHCIEILGNVPITANGGAGGARGGLGLSTDGADGSAGQVIVLCLTRPVLHSAEDVWPDDDQDDTPQVDEIYDDDSGDYE